jgi:hypothetical protein
LCKTLDRALSGAAEPSLKFQKKRVALVEPGSALNCTKAGPLPHSSSGLAEKPAVGSGNTVICLVVESTHPPEEPTMSFTSYVTGKVPKLVNVLAGIGLLDVLPSKEKLHP